MNLIDRDKLIEKLNECIDMTKRYIENVDSAVIKRQLIGRREVLEIVLEGVSNQPPVNQWISCKERLPEEPLIGCDGYIVQQYNVVEPFSAYWDGEKWTDGYDELEGIIGWQPLPPRYKE